MNGIGHVLLTLRCIILSDADIDTDGEADKELDDEVHQRSGRSDGGHRLRAHETADDHDVGRIKQKLKHRRRYQRQCKGDDLRHDDAGGHIHLIFLTHITYQAAYEARSLLVRPKGR